MTMAKPKTELVQRCPPPPYTRWDQRGKPVLLSYLRLIDGKHLCLSLETDDPGIARRHMRLLVAKSLAGGRLSPDSGAAKVYAPKVTRRPRLDDVDTEVRRLKAVSDAGYGPEALAAAKRLGRPVGIIHYLVGRKPRLNAGTYSTRRMGARQRGQRIAMANFWYHRPPRGKGFYKNGRVMTARIQLGRSATTWSLKFRDDAARAAAIMNPVRVAWDHVYEAAKQELNWEIGTAEHTAAAAARVEACGRLAREIHAAGGPKELATFVTTPPRPQAGTTLRPERPRIDPGLLGEKIVWLKTLKGEQRKGAVAATAKELGMDAAALEGSVLSKSELRAARKDATKEQWRAEVTLLMQKYPQRSPLPLPKLFKEVSSRIVGLTKRTFKDVLREQKVWLEQKGLKTSWDAAGAPTRG